MKKLALLLLLASGSALAGGAGVPLSEGALFDNYLHTLTNYARKNINHLPEITNCIRGKYPDIIKPDQLRLNSCGIYKKSKQVYIEFSGEDGGLITFVEGLPANTPQEDAASALQTTVALYEMRYKLGQPIPKICHYVSFNYCQVERSGDKFKIYFESDKGIRLYYDGKKIQDWPKEQN